MLIGTQLAGFGAGGAAAPVSLAFGGGAQAVANPPPATFGSHPIGMPAANRYVVVCVAVQNSSSIVSVTVGGIATTQVVGMVVSTIIPMSIFVTNVPIPSGATASIVVTSSHASAAVKIATYALYDPQSTTPHDTKTTTTDNTALNISVPAGGVCVGFAAAPAGNTFTVANGSEDYDNGTTLAVAAAHTTTTGTVALTFDAVSTFYGAVAASFL